jgi:DNA-binding CsgD family transcriptional regulator
MRGYLRVHLSYTFLMLTALFILYLKVNVIKSPLVMSFFIIAILLGQGILSWALSRFSFIVNKEGITRGLRVFWNTVPFFYVLLAFIHYFLMDTHFTLIPVIIGFSLFLLISLYFMRRNSRVEKKDPGENRVWLLFLFFTLFIISLELYLKFRYGFLGDYTINIPIIFLSWNFLTVIHFKDQLLSQTGAEKTLISREKIQQWQLTGREVDVAQAIIRGDSNKDIAWSLNISFSTVKNHIYNIYRKTGAKSRIELLNLCSGNNYP